MSLHNSKFLVLLIYYFLEIVLLSVALLSSNIIGLVDKSKNTEIYIWIFLLVSFGFLFLFFFTISFSDLKNDFKIKEFNEISKRKSFILKFKKYVKERKLLWNLLIGSIIWLSAWFLYSKTTNEQVHFNSKFDNNFTFSKKVEYNIENDSIYFSIADINVSKIKNFPISLYCHQSPCISLDSAQLIQLIPSLENNKLVFTIPVEKSKNGFYAFIFCTQTFSTIYYSDEITIDTKREKISSPKDKFIELINDTIAE